MGGTSIKESCSSHQDNIETTPHHVNKIQRLKMIVESLQDIYKNIQLSHVLDQYYVLPKSTIQDFLKGVND